MEIKSKGGALPDYERPPVIEVVCGILFEPIQTLTAPHVGILWEKFKPAYSRCKEAAPLVPAVERFTEDPPRKTLELENLFGLSRTWFETEDGNGLIQIQRDRFLHNWKKVQKDDEYPHYDYVVGNFGKHFGEFENFLKEQDLGAIEPLQYEMTYVNHIPKGEGWNTLDDLKKVFPDMAWRNDASRFLGSPEAINSRMSFVLPNREGRLHVSIRSGKRRSDQWPILLFELTARGIGEDKSQAAMWAWFDQAHKWIVDGFTDFTSAEMHKDLWRRLR